MGLHLGRKNLQAHWKGVAVITGPRRPVSGGTEAGRAEAGGEGGPGPASCGQPSPSGSCAWKLVSMDLGNVTETSETGSPDTGWERGRACRFLMVPEGLRALPG